MILGHISLSLTKCHRSESDSRVNIPKQGKMGSTVNYVLPTEHICFRMVWVMCRVSIATWKLCQVATSCITTRLNNDMTSSPPLVQSPTLFTTIRQSGKIIHTVPDVNVLTGFFKTFFIRQKSYLSYLYAKS